MRNIMRIWAVVLLANLSLFFFSEISFADRGESWFYLCASCHGAQGEGDQATGAPAIAGMPQWYLEAQLRKFRQGVRGKHPADIAGMKMRPMARQLSGDDDIVAVAKYVSQLQIPKTPVTIEGKAFKGEQKYQVCVACHGPDGEGNQALNAPPLTNTNDWYLYQQLKNFKSGVRGANAAIDPSGATMAPMSMTLDEEGMRDVIAYIRSLK